MVYFWYRRHDMRKARAARFTCPERPFSWTGGEQARDSGLSRKESFSSSGPALSEFPNKQIPNNSCSETGSVDRPQCAISTGTIMLSSKVRLAPPSTISRTREWP